LQDPPKFTQIEIFGLKICHLATLEPGATVRRSGSFLFSLRFFEFEPFIKLGRRQPSISTNEVGAVKRGSL
jgi:hypothetical protein